MPQGAQHPGTCLSRHEYTFTASALDLALFLLSTELAQSCMVNLTCVVDKNIAKTQRISPALTPASAQGLVGSFVQILRNNPPQIVIDSVIGDRQVLAYHKRVSFEGAFDTASHSIHLNAKLVHEMVASSQDQKTFARYQFQISHVLAHELAGHLLITYLYNGVPLTPVKVRPPQLKSRGGADTKAVGESGRMFEDLLFGGPIAEAAIYSAVMDRVFYLPYPLSQPLAPVDGVSSTQKESNLASGVSFEETQLIESVDEPVYSISRRALSQVPRDPSVLAQVRGD
ncbi:hypothetical protein FQN54_002856 [Arachnomyces sp. PD_36]|nr:hypothetical protein FQN54_002856 [Arachnomyces sp. PD_36]